MPEPTYAELLADHAQLLEQQDEWRKEIQEQGAEIERLTLEQHTDLVPKVLYEQLQAELVEARRERDEAVAHDRQPYPTAWAYEQAVKTIERLRAELAKVAIGGAHEHPEKRCNRCGRGNVDWSAPSPLWNQVMRDGDINKVPEPYGGIICPACFAVLAQEAGIARRWRFYAEVVNVELATVTPSGRVWNPQTWLWEEPSGSVPFESAPAAEEAADDHS